MARAFIALLVRSRMSQADAARALHYSTATISRWCSGDVPCPKSALDHLIRVTGLRPDQPGLVELRDGPVWLDEWQVELLALIGGLPTERRTKIMAAIRELVGAISPGVRYRVQRGPRAPKQADPVPSTTELVETIGGDIIAAASNGTHGEVVGPSIAAPPDRPAPIVGAPEGARVPGTRRIERKGK